MNIQKEKDIQVTHIIKILMIEDNPGDARLIQEALSEVTGTQFELQWVKSLSQGVEYIRKSLFEVILLDLSLPDSQGLDTVININKHAKNLPFIVLTGLNDEKIGLKAVSTGAQDFLVKGQFDPNMLSRVIHYAIERKNVEEALRESENKLKAKNEEILEFTDTVTHDLKSPLAAIKNICVLFKNDTNLCTLSEEGQELLTMGNESIEYMQELLEDLLTCAKLEAGSQHMEMEEVNVNNVIEKVLQRFQLQVQKKNIAITKDVNSKIYANKKGITKVFMNLIGNAINYIGEEKNPKIHISTIKQESNGQSQFSVRDNGIGIPHNIQKDIFNKFKRGSNASGIKGTGLGLSIAKSIIEAHKGKIWFDSKEGEGTTFYFTIQEHPTK